MIRRAIVILIVATLYGCVSTAPIPKLPEALDGDGLLVGEIYMPGSYRWDSSEVIINGRTYNASLRDGYLAIKLPVGEYTIESLRTYGWNEKVSRYQDDTSPYVKTKGTYRAPTYVYVPGTPTYTYYTLLPIKQKFTIEAQRITNLGMYVFLVDPKDAKKFYTVKLDNNKEMAHFLDTNYPKLMATITNRTPVPMATNFMEASKLPELRKMIAAKEAALGRVAFVGQQTLVYGGAGTAVLYTFDSTKKGAPPVAQVVETGTLADIKGAQVQGGRVTLLSADAQIHIIENGKTVRRPIPYRVHPLRFRRFDERGIVAVDNRRRMLWSKDDGMSWTKDESAMLDEPTNELDLLTTRDGVYVYATAGVPNSILMRNYAQPAVRTIAAPANHGRVSSHSRAHLFANENALFIDYRALDFHYKPNDRTDWEVRAMPADKCGYIGAVGKTLNVTCDKIQYHSEDGGLNWIKRETTATTPKT